MIGLPNTLEWRHRMAVVDRFCGSLPVKRRRPSKPLAVRLAKQHTPASDGKVKRKQQTIAETKAWLNQQQHTLNKATAHQHKRWDCAIHEAGHAVVAFRLGVQVLCVHSDGDESYMPGHIQLRAGTPDHVIAIIALAGAIAASRDSGYHHEPSDGDIKLVERAILARGQQVGGKIRGELLRHQWRAEARRLVNGNWRDIVNLSRELIAHDGHLKSWQVSRILK